MTSPVIVELKDLGEGKVDSLLPEAFGPDSLGILIVKGLPDEYAALRSKVLHSASKLAELPRTSLEKLENAEAQWVIGWSRGREKLEDGQPDDLKGSYYANCSFYHDDTLEGPPQSVSQDPEYSDLKAYTASNLWPQESEIPNFKRDLKALISVIIDTATVVAGACDRYAQSNLGQYQPGYLQRIVRESTTTKARLLHYFAPTADEIESRDPTAPWCGQHLDHSCLTGLTSAMFLKGSTELDGPPDADSGLYIKNRRGETVKVSIPKDALAFQTGAALEAVTRGEFKAVPHFVRTSPITDVSRNTLAVFCQPSLHEKVTETTNFAQFSRDILRENH